MQNYGGVSEGTLAAMTEALTKPMTGDQLDAAIAKTTTTQGYSTTTGLVGYLLEGPAKSLFPVLSPLRNRFARHGAPIGATAVHWKAITAINAGKVKAGVAEGVRNSVVSTTEADLTQSFKDFGLDDSVTFRAIDAGRGFDDVRARATANLLSAVMVEEEKIILGGNVAVVGAPTSPVAIDAAQAVAGPYTASTAYDFKVSALTLYGYLNGATGHGTADATDETDGVALTTFSTASGRTAITLSWTPVRGAVAYNIFTAAHSSTPYYVATVTATKVTICTAAGAATIAAAPSTYPATTVGTPVVLAAVPTTGNVANTADQTADALSFDGVIPQLQASAGGGYYHNLAGATLTGDNAGGIVEIDTMLQSLYDTARIGPTAMLVNSAQAKDLLTKVTANGSTTNLRLNAQVAADGIIRGGLVLGSYLNKFTQQSVEVITHPYAAPGTITAISERLPFPNNNVPNPFEVEVLREYTQYDWATVQRKFEFGVYASEALKCYFPAGAGSIVGISQG